MDYPTPSLILCLRVGVARYYSGCFLAIAATKESSVKYATKKIWNAALRELVFNHVRATSECNVATRLLIMLIHYSPHLFISPNYASSLFSAQIIILHALSFPLEVQI